MVSIYKYPLEYGRNIIEMPRTQEVLSIGVQGETIMVWALVEPDEKIEKVEILLAGTGQLLKEEMDCLVYLGTVQQGPFVWHGFEVIS